MSDGSRDTARSSADLRGQGLADTRFDGLDLTAVRLSDANLRHAWFDSSNLTRARLDGADLDYVAIADTLNIPVGTVKTRIFRAKAMLRALLEPLREEEAL